MAQAYHASRLRCFHQTVFASSAILSTMIKSNFRSALRNGASRGTPHSTTFASSAYRVKAREAAKWEKITYVGIITCTILAIVNLSKGHPHHEDPPHAVDGLRRELGTSNLPVDQSS